MHMVPDRLNQTPQHRIVGSADVCLQLQTAAVDAAGVVTLEAVLTVEKLLQQSHSRDLHIASHTQEQGHHQKKISGAFVSQTERAYGI